MIVDTLLYSVVRTHMIRMSVCVYNCFRYNLAYMPKHIVAVCLWHTHKMNRQMVGGWQFFFRFVILLMFSSVHMQSCRSTHDAHSLTLARCLN